MESPEAARLSAEDISPSSNGPKAEPMLLDDDPDDLFAEATEEVSLDSPERQPILSDGPSPVITPVTPVMISSRADVFDRSPDQDEDEEENRDTFDIQISVSDPEKVGDGMNAYMVYKVLTKTSLSIFSRDEVCVKRRFSDFLGLHSKLASKFAAVLPFSPPLINWMLMGDVCLCCRYLLRTVKHPALLKDPDVLQFLESSELPRAVSTQALSGAGILRMVNKAADAVNKMTIKMNESDAWFEEKQQQFENLDVQLRKLHASVESLVCHRKELSVNTASFAKSAAMLGNSEDHTALSRAIFGFLKPHARVQGFMMRWFCHVSVLQGVFDQRMKTWAKCQDAQVMLQRKREAEAKLQHANKPDKLQQAKDEIREWEGKVQQGERDFEQISKNIRREVGRFEKDRVKDFRVVIIKYLESLVHTQQQMIKYWEAFLPEAKAIA
uniref:PX domain-containing protein n=1 Tax=Sinocyclocheilus anshuiensis TaxID=1608454 RepID=A0A671N0E0_9TELE